MYQNIYDSHVHSDNSFDGNHSITFLCEQAVEKEIAGICITDHCELRIHDWNQNVKSIAQSVFEVEKANAVFKGRLLVMSGIEVSDVFFDEQKTEEMLSAHPYDLVMLSHHNTNEGEDIYYTDFKTWTVQEIDGYLTDYFTYLYRAMKTGKYDVLAHLTYPLRYISGVHRIQVDMRRYDDIIDELFKTTIEQGKAIEINTSGLWQQLKDTMPPYAYVKRYREMGGEFITLGSDSHSAETLGRGIRSAMQMLEDAGFQYFTFYKQRQPLQLALT